MTEALTNNELVSNIGKWGAMDHTDLTPHVLYQRAEHSVTIAVNYFENLDTSGGREVSLYEKYVWSIEVRDFIVLLRDSLLSTVKYVQFREDGSEVDNLFLKKLDTLISNASNGLVDSAAKGSLSVKDISEIKHQISPVPEILSQIKDLEIQFKKIYRSFDKVDEMRAQLDTFKRDFQVSFQKQVNAVDDIVSTTTVIAEKVDQILPNATKSEIEEVISIMNDSYLHIEELQSLETMDLITYADNSALSIATDVEQGQLVMKTLVPQLEVSKWYSSNVYPHIVELESKRKIAVERSLDALNKMRIKLSGLILDEKEEYNVAATEIKQNISDLRSQYISGLEEERKENTEQIEGHITKELFASEIYSDEHVFLPHSGGVQMNNISRDAQKRMVTSYKNYKKNGYNWFRNSLAKYVELDRVPFNRFISNKLLVNIDDERLSLFLKDGYLGKSFTVNRTDVTEPILNDYKLWLTGFSGSVLLSGAKGSGKSTILGLLSQEHMNETIITVRPGEQYFTRNKSFNGVFNLNEVIQNISLQYIGKRIVLAIDNLESWHSNEISLFDNLSSLFSKMQSYNGDIFFIVCCQEVLVERIQIFKKLNKVFSSHIRLKEMAKTAVLEALRLRSKALPELGLLDADQEEVLSDVVRIADGNVGHAMLEYCRFYSKDYQPNLKSQEFVQLIRENETLIKYVLSFESIRMQDLVRKLNEIDYRNTSENIRYLVGHKIMTYMRGDVVTINPYLIFAVERALKTKVQ